MTTPTVVLTNNKGGVGKTTTTTNFAYGLCQSLKQAGAANPRVLIVDTDSQAHATLTTTGSKDYSRHKSICAVLGADRKEMVQVLSQVIVESHWLPELHVLPSSTELEQTERELFSAAGAPYRLADALSTIRHHYAAIVIDIRPSFSLMTEMSLLAATDAIIALEPRYLETVGLQSVINKIMEIREGWRHPDLRLSGIVVTKMDRRVKGHIEMIEQIKQHPTLGKLVCGVIPANEAVAYAHRSHMSIYEYDPSSAAAEAYAHMVGWMLKRLFVKDGERV
ncbi:MAG: ParA family protein [Anaerolineae bacterium]|nr:MAG: ParA family protein [Anaerolineae bacterium]